MSRRHREHHSAPHHEPHRIPANVQRVHENALVRSFHYAIEGIIYATRSQRNVRIHFLLGTFVLLGMLVLHLQRVYVMVLILLVALVIAFELLNTAIESVVDLLTVVHHPLAQSRQGYRCRCGTRHEYRGNGCRLPCLL